MKSIYRFVFLFLALLAFNNTYSQDFQGYIVKKIGSLVVVDIGSKKGLIENSSYVIKKVESIKLPLLKIKIASKEFILGQFAITQLKNNYAIGKILKPTKKKFDVGDKINIYFYSYSDFISEQNKIPVTKVEPEVKQRIETEDIPFETIKKEDPAKKPIEMKMPWEKRNPIYLGGGYSFGIKSIPDRIVKNIEEFLVNEIYIDNPQISSSIKQSTGFSFNIGYFPLSFLSVDLGYVGLRNTSTLSSISRYAADVEISGPLPLDPIKSWDFEIRTNINIFSLSVNLGKYNKIIENYQSNLKNKDFVYYFGGGINYCNLGINFDENYVMYGINNREDLVYRSEKFSSGKYTGWFVNAGGGYLAYGGLIFTELRYQQWGNLKFDKSIQFIVGFKTFF